MKHARKPAPQAHEDTFWKVGDKVYSRWNPADVGIVIAVEVVYDGKAYKLGQSHKVERAEWTKVRFSDGREKEYLPNEIARDSQENANAK